MYFEIYINDKIVATVGHEEVRNLSISLHASPDGNQVFAGAVCNEDDKQFHYSWLQHNVEPTDQITIKRCAGGKSPSPIKKYEMGRSKNKTRDQYSCDFCQRKPSEDNPIVPGDDNRPTICLACVDLCHNILKQNKA